MKKILSILAVSLLLVGTTQTINAQDKGGKACCSKKTAGTQCKKSADANGKACCSKKTAGKQCSKGKNSKLSSAHKVEVSQTRAAKKDTRISQTPDQMLIESKQVAEEKQQVEAVK